MATQRTWADHSITQAVADAFNLCKHSVLHGDKLRQSNPGVKKCLYSKTSVNDIEWVCKTCHGHLTQNKVPLCAVQCSLYPVCLS